MNFKSQLQEWILLDNQIKKVNEEIKEIRNRRSQLSTNILDYVSNNNLKNSTIQVGDKEKLKFMDTRIQEPLTLKYLEKTLTEIIKNESQIKLIMDHIRKKRNVKVMPEIKRILPSS